MAASIQGIYLALFGRPADPAGLAFFNGVTGNGADLTAIGDLASTDEYQSRFIGMSNEEIINSIYQSLFGRDGEASGIDFYLGELEAGRLTINTIAIGILNGAQGTDLDTINAKIDAANLFTTHLDLPAEVIAYDGDAAAAIGREFIATVNAGDPGTAEEADAAILKLFPDEGQQPGGGGGVVNPPVNQPGTVVIHGDAEVGTTLTAEVTADANGVPSSGITYEWLRDGTVIDTGADHTVQLEDQGYTLTARASYIDDDGFANVATSSTATVPETSSGAAIDLYDYAGHWLAGYDTIQDAVDNAGGGYRVVINQDILDENVLVNVGALTIEGRAGADIDLLGTFKSDNGIAAGTTVSTWLQDAPGYSAAAGSAFVVTGANVVIRNLGIDGFAKGVELGTGSDSLVVDGVEITNAVAGFSNADGSADTHTSSEITIRNSSVRDSYEGIDFAQKAFDTEGFINGLVIDNVSFSNITAKGIYLEAVSSTAITDVTMTEVGQYGRGKAFGVQGEFGNGIDINLKYAAYHDIVIDGFTLTNVGLSNGGGSIHKGGAAIAIKTRDDGGNYGAHPASYAGAIAIKNGSIDGTSVGIRAGEPDKTNAGPDIVVTGVEIEGTAGSTEGDNVTQSTFTITLTDDGDFFRAATTATGDFHITDGAGNDTIHGGKTADILISNAGSDTVGGGGGADTITLGAGVKTVVFEATATANGIDTFTGFDGGDKLDFTDFIDPDSFSTVRPPRTGVVNDDAIIAVEKGELIHGQDYGGADFSELFATGGPLRTQATNPTQAVVLVQGNDETQIYYVDNTDDNIIEETDVTLIGVLSGLSNATTLTAANFIGLP